MSRLKASVIHLGATVLVLGGLYAVARRVWYPQPLWQADGAGPGFALVAAALLVLGPVLTLIAYRPGKKRLRLDLAIIGLLQLAVLVWGGHMLYMRRIRIVVYSRTAFYALDPAHIARIGPRGRTLLRHAQEPLYVYVHLPHSKLALEQAEIRTLQGEPPLFLRGWRYRPYTKRQIPRVMAAGIPLVAIAAHNARAAAVLKRFEVRHGQAQGYAFVPLHGTYATVLLALHKNTGQVAAVLPFSPGYGQNS